NYSQDSNAKSSLEAVKSAQVLYQAKNASFGDVTALTGGTDPALSASAPNVVIASNATSYCAIVKSGSMFGGFSWITSQSSKITSGGTAPALTGVTGAVTCPTTVP
ncbi:hypothetical protein, partial [Cryobacterium zhongshanensis]